MASLDEGLNESLFSNGLKVSATPEVVRGLVDQKGSNRALERSQVEVFLSPNLEKKPNPHFLARSHSTQAP